MWFSSKFLCAPAAVTGMLGGFVTIFYFYSNPLYKNVDSDGNGNEDNLGEWRQHSHLTAAVVNICLIVIVQLVMLKFFPQHVDDELRTFDAIPKDVRNMWARASGYGARSEEKPYDLEEDAASQKPKPYDMAEFKKGTTEPLDTKIGLGYVQIILQLVRLPPIAL